MEILKPYNDSTLQLISDDTSYEFTPSLLEGGSIKLSVFSDIGSFQDSEDLQQDIDFYVSYKINIWIDFYRVSIKHADYIMNYSKMKINCMKIVFVMRVDLRFMKLI